MPKKSQARKKKTSSLEEIPKDLISKVMRALGSKGGKAKGNKARTTEQARAAARARWDKVKSSDKTAED